MFLEQQIGILEWFLKDHVTLKTGIMMLKIQLCVTGINTFKMYSHRKHLFQTVIIFTFTFTFMHLADAFIQSDLQLHPGYTFSLVHVFPGNRTHNLLRCWRNALPLSHTGTYFTIKLYSVVYCTFDQINATLMSKSYFFQKYKKILPQFFVTAKYKMFHFNFCVSYKKNKIKKKKPIAAAVVK